MFDTVYKLTMRHGNGVVGSHESMEDSQCFYGFQSFMVSIVRVYNIHLYHDKGMNIVQDQLRVNPHWIRDTKFKA